MYRVCGFDNLVKLLHNIWLSILIWNSWEPLFENLSEQKHASNFGINKSSDIQLLIKYTEYTPQARDIGFEKKIHIVNIWIENIQGKRNCAPKQMTLCYLKMLQRPNKKGNVHRYGFSKTISPWERRQFASKEGDDLNHFDVHV